MNETETILLADDSPDDLFLLRTAFKSARLFNPVREVLDGDAAIAYLGGAPPFDDRSSFPLPAVMLLDLNMPRRDGFQVLEWVRRQPGLRRLMVFVLTASLRQEDLDRAFDLGANAFLVKPGSLDGLVAMSRALAEWIRVLQLPHLSVPAQG